MPPRTKTDRLKGDVTAAFKVISSGHLGLTRAEMFVANAILRHVGAKDDTCFPSVERLAAMSKIAPRNVINATNALCTGPGRLFDKFRKAGKGKTSTCNYTPRWQRFRELESDIEDIFMGRHEDDEGSNSDASVTLNSDASVTLTPVQLTPVYHPLSPTASQASSSVAEPEPETQSEPKRRSALDDDRIRLKVVPRSNAPMRGERKASERWNADLLRCGQRIYGEVIEWLPEAVADEATQEERQKYHQGAAHIARRLLEAGHLDLAACVSMAAGGQSDDGRRAARRDAAG
ncbi:hypothetical protein [Rhizobium sp. Leaf341]|uniref:hypothetical protein n=1 Tax=Rhizobium sp. Leaf341 TaxID=1736344 RepID=UPI000715B817|nr:hypothetical protein [Rhizobium sp. Leaf341]KQR77799.1 hypothetical protein ASG03_15620 [Rhizobium sp. Leaf341]